MLSDTALKCEAVSVLTDVFGVLDAERIIGLIKRDSFDYTVWRERLFDEMTFEQLGDAILAEQENY